MEKAVFFDYMGTLIVSGDIDAAWDWWFDVYYGFMLSHVADLGFKDFKTRVLGSMSVKPLRKAEGYSTFMLQIREVAESCGVVLARENIASLADSLIVVWNENMSLDPEAIPTLRKLRERYLLGLISNWNHPPSLRKALKDQGLEGLFDSIIISDEVGIQKPDPGIFHEALGRVGVEPENTVYVGDDPVDVEGSLAAGIHPIVIRREGAGYWDKGSNRRISEELLSNATVIRNLRELEGVLKDWSVCRP